MIIGNATSARDMLKEISPVAKEVHQAIRGSDIQFKKSENHNNCWQHPMVSCFGKKKSIFKQLWHWKLETSIFLLMNSMFLQIECTHKDGKVVFQDGSFVYADVILHCTGYWHHIYF